MLNSRASVVMTEDGYAQAFLDNYESNITLVNEDGLIKHQLFVNEANSILF